MDAPLPASPPRLTPNRRLAWQLALVAVGFSAFGFALVPLYDVFCRLTGLNGRTNAQPWVEARNTQVDATRWVKVEFLSHAMPGTSLSLKAESFSMQVHPGSIVHTQYMVRNDGDHAFVGQAVPSITPATAAAHFRKVECFCFSQQSFAPGEERTLPVVFVVDPRLDRDIGTVTLSYTFFEAPRRPS